MHPLGTLAAIPRLDETATGKTLRPDMRAAVELQIRPSLCGDPARYSQASDAPCRGRPEAGSKRSLSATVNKHFLAHVV